MNMNLMVVKGLLRGTKVQIDTAQSGVESVELAKENKYDLIFMDHMMPGMELRHFNKSVNKKMERTKELRLLFLLPMH